MQSSSSHVRKEKLKRSASRNESRTLTLGVVIVLSFLSSAALLALERAVGIGWDFHPDAVTYATTSKDAYDAIVDNWAGVFNNGYYVLSYLLGESVIAITLMNMVLFALTNGLIYKWIKAGSSCKISDALMLLLLLNPYRMHLSTTMLKESLIIFLMILLIKSSYVTRTVAFLSMVVLRLASPVYLIALIPRKYIFYIVLIGLALTAVFWDVAFNRILEFNDQEMQLRDFDTVPTFQEFGFWGAIVRGIAWSLLSFTGAFALISPAPAFIPVAVGSIMTLVFVKKATGGYTIPLQLLIATALFGVMVTGFTAYIRYIYPILVAWPLIAIRRDD